jgi:hypothetical protein
VSGAAGDEGVCALAAKTLKLRMAASETPAIELKELRVGLEVTNMETQSSWDSFLNETRKDDKPAGLTRAAATGYDPGMQSEIDEPTFLRDLVKASRQKIHQVKWIDRDGTERVTRLSLPEHARLNEIARDQGTSMSEVMRQAAHVPVVR